jgi:hypothetical protein
VLHAPAASICHEAATKLFTLSRERRETTLPAAQQSGHGPKLRAVAGEPTAKRRPHESDEPGKAESHAQPTAGGERLATGQKHLNERDVKRNDGQDQRCQAAGDGFFRVDQADVSPAEKQQANQAQEEHVFGRPDEAQAAPSAPDQQKRACGKEARSREKECGHLGHSDADGGVGGTPEDVDAQEGEHDARGGGGCML